LRVRRRGCGLVERIPLGDVLVFRTGHDGVSVADTFGVRCVLVS
jgi:hypothetical protein